MAPQVLASNGKASHRRSGTAFLAWHTVAFLAQGNPVIKDGILLPSLESKYLVGPEEVNLGRGSQVIWLTVGTPSVNSL